MTVELYNSIRKPDANFPGEESPSRRTMRNVFSVLLGPGVLVVVYVLLIVFAVGQKSQNFTGEVNGTEENLTSSYTIPESIQQLHLLEKNGTSSLSYIKEKFFDYSVFVKAAPFLYEPSKKRSLSTYNESENVQEFRGCDSNHDDDFPTVFTEQELKRGAILLAFLIAIYCFTLLAIICDKYFLPCVERICEVLTLPQDVAAATFMAMATSAPELFVNIIGTFLTKSDIGIGTVVGSSMFNTLGVAAVGSLAASTPIKVDWWPVTRDCLMYICQISVLVCIVWDGYVYWYEATILFIDLFFYFTFLFSSNRMANCVKKCVRKDVNEITISSEQLTKVDIKLPTEGQKQNSNESSKTVREENQSGWTALFTLPDTMAKKIFFFYTWPINFALQLTVPDPIKYPKVFPISFFACIIWIGSNSYMVSWMISIIGATFGIPEVVLGLTFLAAGGCLPEAISLTIMSRRGQGSMGLSNSLGANSMNILLSLGLPWFIKTMTLGTNDHSFIKIESGSIVYTILALNLVTAALFITLVIRKFTLSRLTGVILMCAYLIFISFAIMSEIFWKTC